MCVWCVCVAELHGMWDLGSSARDGTRPRGVEAWGLNRWATREVAECALTRIVASSAACCEVLSGYRWHYVCVI